MNGWVVFALLAAAYLGVYLLIRQRARRTAPSVPADPVHVETIGRGEVTPKQGIWGFDLAGPLLLWRTQWGKRAIEKVARPKRFWNVVADLGIWLTWIMGIAIFALLVLSLWQYISQPREVAANAPPVEFLIGLPGVNPLIPVGYGILALIIALVIHEGSHGVMAYVANLRVKALGLVFFIVPIGAFVEPHDEDLMKATTRQKNRVFAAGPTSNIVLAVVAGLILSTMFAAQMHIENNGQGVVVGSVEPGSAAELAGLQHGDLMTKVNGQSVATRADYTSVMANTTAGQRIEITFLRNGETRTTTAVLGDRYDYIQKVAPDQNTPENKGKGFLGVSGLGLDGLDNVRDVLQHPFGSVGSFFFYIGYPFFVFTQGIDVLSAPYNGMFSVTGPLAFLPAPVFFGLAELLFWIVWLNLMLGTFNALPAGPLDGGQMFRATLSERLMKRYHVDEEKIEVERLEMGGLQLKGKDPETQMKLDRVNINVSRATRSVGYFILALILLPVFAPPLIRLFG